jgi:hypothetical protein
VTGQIIVDGCDVLFNRFVCTIRTGRVLPGSVYMFQDDVFWALSLRDNIMPFAAALDDEMSMLSFLKLYSGNDTSNNCRKMKTLTSQSAAKLVNRRGEKRVLFACFQDAVFSFATISCPSLLLRTMKCLCLFLNFYSGNYRQFKKIAFIHDSDVSAGRALMLFRLYSLFPCSNFPFCRSGLQ